MRGDVVTVKRFKAVFLLLGVVAALAFAAHVMTRAPAAGPPLALVQFYDKSDKTVTLADFKGQPVLVNLWATWCTPCVAEMPALDKLQAKYPKTKFRVVAVSVDMTSMKTVTDFFAKHGIRTLDAYWDKDRQTLLKWSYAGLPTSYLLDAEGGVVKRYDGVVDWADLDEQLGALLP